MKDLNQVISEYVLRSISDDYEYIEAILEDVANWTSECGTTVDSNAVLKALEELIRDGYAQAYVLHSAPTARAEAVKYSSDRVHDYSYYVTPKGKRLARDLMEEWRRGERPDSDLG